MSRITEELAELDAPKVLSYSEPLVSRTTPRPVGFNYVTNEMARALSDGRHESDLTEMLPGLVAKYALALDAEQVAALIADVDARVRADKVYDSEKDQALRALRPAMRNITDLVTRVIRTTRYEEKIYIRETILAVGWIRGESVVVNGQRFSLTGSACPQCQINPQAHGENYSGVQCVDRVECAWWYCA